MFKVIKVNKVDQCSPPEQTMVSVLGEISLPVINFRLAKVRFIWGGEGGSEGRVIKKPKWDP